MKSKNNKKITDDLLKNIHRIDRNAEIEAFGKTINHNNIVVSKKVYTRKSKHKIQFE